MNSWQIGHTNGPVASYPRLAGAAPAPPLTAQPGRLAQMLPRWSCWWGHSHRATRQPDPGMDALAYQALGLVEFSPIGWGDHNRQQLNPLAGPTLFAGRALATSGIGGLAQGQFITQPLIVPQQLLSEDLGTDSNWIGLD
jgi:hypothetical protein